MAVVDVAHIDSLLARLRAAPPRDERELDRVYRSLLKATHPDRSHDDGRAFMYLRERFTEYRAEWNLARARQALARRSDRQDLLRDLGLSPDLAVRPALFASLYRFRSLGLSSYRVRSRPSLRARNARVIRAIIANAYDYDPAFVPIFQTFLLHHGNFAMGERQAPLYFMVRRMILKALDGLIRYQDRGRPATSAISRDTIRYARSISVRYLRDPAFEALFALADWLEAELERPPEPIGLDL